MQKVVETNNINKKVSTKNKKGTWIFMAFSLLLLLLVFIFNKEKGIEATKAFYHLIIEILPFLLVVFILMVLINLYLKMDVIKKHMGKESGIKGWIIAIVAGLLSMGAIYMWFPLLKDIINKGVKPGLVAVFLYNRAIKLHWLPLMAFYFGVKYVFVLTVITILVSVLQGNIIDFIFKEEKHRRRGEI